MSQPTVEELSTNIVAGIESSLEQSVPLLPKAFIRVLAKVLAAVLVIVYRYAGWILLQQYISTASAKETTVLGRKIRPLIELGRENGTGDPIDAQHAELVIEVTVINQTGSLATGSQLLREDTGVLYLTTAPVALDAATVSVTIRAATDQDGGDAAGTIGNLEVGETVEFASPINIGATATVTSVAKVGVDAETTEAYRARVLRREQAKPQGGAYADYRAWGEKAPGVVAVYPYTGAPGYVDVYIECDSDLDADGIPDGTVLAAALAAINLDDDGLATRRNANMKPNVMAISRTSFQVAVAGLAATDLAGTQAAIATGVDEFLRSREPFIEGLSVLPRLDRVTQGEIGGVVSEIASAAGATVLSITLRLSGADIEAYTLGEGEKAKLAGGEITWE